jgi:hypothetical protein
MQCYRQAKYFTDISLFEKLEKLTKCSYDARLTGSADGKYFKAQI